jgi:hypothetical protein
MASGPTFLVDLTASMGGLFFGQDTGWISGFSHYESTSFAPFNPLIEV